jgi:glycerol uptake facilitator-like aquaporin
VSGAHFNPAVTAVFGYRSQIASHLAIGYIAVQVAGRMDCRPGLKAVR